MGFEVFSLYGKIQLEGQEEVQAGLDQVQAKSNDLSGNLGGLQGTLDDTSAKLSDMGEAVGEVVSPLEDAKTKTEESTDAYVNNREVTASVSMATRGLATSLGATNEESTGLAIGVRGLTTALSTGQIAARGFMSALGPTVAIMAAVTAVGFLVAKLKEHKSASDDDLDSIENMSTAYGKLADNVASAEAKLKSVVTSGAATAEQIVAAEQTLSTERSKSDKEKQEDLDKYNESLKKKQDLEAIIAIREAQIATGQFYIDPLPPDAVDKMAKYNQEIATYAEYQAKLAAAQNIVTRGNVLNVQTMALKEVNAQLEIAKQKYKDDEASCLGYKDRLVSLNTALDGEKTKLKAAQDQLGKDTDAYHTALDAVKGYSDQIKELQDQIASPSQSTQAQAIQTEIDRLNLQKLQAADGTDTTAIDAQLAALQKQKDILDLQIKIAEDEANTPEAQIAQLKIKQQAAQDAADAALKAMQSDTTSINELNRSIIATQTSIDTINNKIKTALAHDQEAIDLKTSVVNNITQMVADSKTELDKLSAQLSGTLDLYNFNIAAAAALANANAPLPSVSVAPVYPGQAVGGITRSPGLSWVGEAGPELLSLPAGATVTPLDKVGGGIYVTVNVAGSVTAERNLADIIGEQIVSQVRESIGARR